MRFFHCAAITGFWVLAVPGMAQEWTEESVVRRFLEQSPQVREARARAAIAGAEALGRRLSSNPRVRYVREGAGMTEFLQAEQTLHLSGRFGLLRQAGESAVRAAEADGAFDLWQARTSLRLAFYGMLAGQERERLYEAGVEEMDRVIAVLRRREQEGEGSSFDRLRTERERAELAAELEVARAGTQLERAALLAFLPSGDDVERVAGALAAAPQPLDAAALAQRAMGARQDVRAEQHRLTLFRQEQRAAERLRIPEPTVSAGFKRADIGMGVMARGGVVEIGVPLPLFNKGQAEVSRFTAEQERVNARLEMLARQVRALVEGQVRNLTVRAAARDRYRKELANTGEELIRIARVAYEEGEIGILQLLDAYRTVREGQVRMLELELSVREARIELERVMGEELAQ